MDISVMKMLLKFGASPDTKDNYGASAYSELYIHLMDCKTSNMPYGVKLNEERIELFNLSSKKGPGEWFGGQLVGPYRVDERAFTEVKLDEEDEDFKSLKSDKQKIEEKIKTLQAAGKKDEVKAAQASLEIVQ